ncbi:hypothetical protein [Methylobacterium nonmethylotrophicum]|uniref:Uncharacterized protein n=1 Tax=Methylobacterium nonmethylotrophicum TaxID=1141884 RepID=A0A4Z0NRD8_9HYPH|nr:hypothetical protein [Methylobacterium nonmethylotrophicum]TGD98773.1 hypothetical protein EU555_15705 [Methylobacterium nonmethylotrophicum]
MAQGHPVEIRERTLPVLGGIARLPGGVERAGDPLRHPALASEAAASSVTPSILVPDGTDLAVLAARPARHPAAVEARVGAAVAS